MVNDMKVKHGKYMNDNLSEFAQKLIDAVPCAMLTVDLECKITSWNVMAEQITGYSKEEVLGKKCQNFIFEECTGLCDLEGLGMHKPMMGQKCNITTKSGATKTISKNIDLIRGQNEESMGAIACFEDVSERLRMEQLLHESEERYAAILQNTPEVVIIQQRGKIVFINEAGRCGMGYVDEEVINKDALSFFTPESRLEIMRMLRERPNAEIASSFEAEFITKKGIIKNVLVKSIPITYNKESSILSLVVDITEQKEYEDNLLRKERLLTALAYAIKQLLSKDNYALAIDDCFESLGQAADVDRVYLFRNEYNEENEGFTSQIAEWNRGTSSSQLDNPQLMKIPFVEISGFIKPLMEGTVFSEIVRCVKDETVRELLETQSILTVAVFPVFVNHIFWGFIGFDECKYERIFTKGELSSLSAFASALEKAIERTIVQEDLQKAKIEAESASVMKSQFLANMSHEIRTPINGIIGFLDLLQRTDLSSVQRDYIKEAKKAAEHLTGLVSDILDFSRIEAGKMNVEKTSFNPVKVIEEAVTLIIPKAYEKKLEVQIKIDPFVSLEVVGDPIRIVQVLGNLLSNSLKFTKQGVIVVSLCQENLNEQESSLIFTVEDSGIGIREEVLEQLFKPFTQADNSTTRVYGGTGLGLAISKELVRLMGGDIDVESRIGVGSKFTFNVIVENINAEKV